LFAVFYPVASYDLGRLALSENLLLNFGEFTVRPMYRATNKVRQKNLASIDPEVDAA